MKVPVYLVTSASFYLGDVDIQKPEDFDDAAEKLWESKGWDHPTLCHQCGEIDLADFDIGESQAEYYFKPENKRM